MDITTIITTVITGIISGGFTLAVTLITMKIRARKEANDRIWQRIEFTLDKALEGKTPEAREAGRRAARALAASSNNKEVKEFVVTMIGNEEASKIILK